MYTFRLRRATRSEWIDSNPVLELGEPGFERDTFKLKVGDGTRTWVQLPYIAASAMIDPADVSDDALLAHINANEPHPVYDDGPSLALLYENAKV